MQDLLNSILSNYNNNDKEVIVFMKEENEDQYHIYKGKLLEYSNMISLTIIFNDNDCIKNMLQIYNNIEKSRYDDGKISTYYYHNGFSINDQKNKRCILCFDNMEILKPLLKKIEVCNKCLEKYTK